MSKRRQAALHDTVRVLLADLPDAATAGARLESLARIAMFTIDDIIEAVETVYPERIGTTTNRTTGLSRRFYSDKRVEALRNA